MANETITLTDKALRKTRKFLTRDKDGSFEVCADHERRMRATAFDLVIASDKDTGEMTLLAAAKLSCGHSKHPCTDSKRVILADTKDGIAPFLKKVSAATAADDDDDDLEEAA